MKEYTYKREKLDKLHSYNVNHPDRETPLAKEIKAVFPRFLGLSAHADQMVLRFDDPELTTEEQTTLDKLIADHKANTV